MVNFPVHRSQIVLVNFPVHICEFDIGKRRNEMHFPVRHMCTSPYASMNFPVLTCELPRIST